MDEMWQLPPRGPEGASAPTSACPTPADVLARLREAWTRVTALDRAGDAVIAAALDAAHAGQEAVESFAGRVRIRLDEASAAELSFESVMYDCAAEALADDQVAEGWVGLLLLLDTRWLRPLAMLGLAVCAAKLGHHHEARLLALGSRAEDASHPRAFLIAGYSESQRGHLRQAQRYFAVASRLARHRPGHAADLRMAQRLLLTLQMT